MVYFYDIYDYINIKAGYSRYRVCASSVYTERDFIMSAYYKIYPKKKRE